MLDERAVQLMHEKFAGTVTDAMNQVTYDCHVHEAEIAARVTAEILQIDYERPERG